MKRSATVLSIALIGCLAAPAPPVGAQGLELMPFGGYRFGGDFFEIATGHSADLDGSPALGFVVNVPLSNGLQVEALVTQQRAQVPVAAAPFGPEALRRVTVGYAQVGGLQEFSEGRVRPFLTGVFGLTAIASTLTARSASRSRPAAASSCSRSAASDCAWTAASTFVDADVRFLARGGTCLTTSRQRRLARSSPPASSFGCCDAG
jgi:hypothetical protein